jgi:hypothetical protein
MMERYAAAKTYTDTGVVQITHGSHVESTNTPARQVSFATAFDREANRFRFDMRFDDQRAVDPVRSTFWRTGPGPLNTWWSDRAVIERVSLEDALYYAGGRSGGASFRIPALLLGKTNWGLDGLEFQVLRKEIVKGRACYVLSASQGETNVTLWIAQDDHALLKIASGSDSNHSTIQYTPRFDEALAEQRFAVAPATRDVPGDSCVGRGVVADGSDPLIDDIADGDIRLRPADHRRGHWWTFGDEGCYVTPQDSAHAAAPGGKNSERFAMYVQAKNCTQWGFGIGFALNEAPARCAYDASVYDGIYFWARSGAEPVQIHFTVGSRKTQPIAYGGDGTCEASGRASCWAAHWAEITLTPEWKAYAFTWKALKDPSWPLKTPFDVKEITSMGWTATSASPKTERAIWIGRVGFFKGAPPKSPFGN